MSNNTKQEELQEEIARYYDVLKASAIDLEPYINLASDLDKLSKAGRINDMRRLLVVRLLSKNETPKTELDANLKSVLGAYAVEERREVLKLINSEVTSVLEELENDLMNKSYTNTPFETERIDAKEAYDIIQSIKEKYNV